MSSALRLETGREREGKQRSWTHGTQYVEGEKKDWSVNIQLNLACDYYAERRAKVTFLNRVPLTISDHLPRVYCNPGACLLRYEEGLLLPSSALLP